jgi:hypothetical protein
MGKSTGWRPRRKNFPERNNATPLAQKLLILHIYRPRCRGYCAKPPAPVKVVTPIEDTPVVQAPVIPPPIVVAPPIVAQPKPAPPIIVGTVPEPEIIVAPPKPIAVQPTPPVTITEAEKKRALISALIDEQRAAEDSLKKNQDAEIEARKRLASNPDYIEAVKIERDLNDQVEKNRREHLPDLDVSARWIAAKGNLAKIEKADPSFSVASNGIAASLANLAKLRKRIADETKPVEENAPSAELKSSIAKRELAVGMTYAEACQAARAQGVIFSSRGTTIVYRWPVTSRVGSHQVVTGTHYNIQTGTYRNEYEEVPDYEVTSYVEATFTDGKLISFQKIMANEQQGIYNRPPR